MRWTIFMNSTIIVALLATFTAIITAIITDFLNKRSRLKFEERKLKEQYYLEFIHALSENMNNLESTEATIKYNHAFNNLAIIASPEVLLSLYELANLMINHIKNNNVSDYENKYTKLFTVLVKEMRSDLYGKKSGKVNKGLNEIYLISGVLKVRPEEDEK